MPQTSSITRDSDLQRLRPDDTRLGGHTNAQLANRLLAAAVADWRPALRADQKMKKQGGPPPALELIENPDILRAIATHPRSRPRLVIGFAAETQQLEEHARAKLARKGADWIIANDVSGDVMGGEKNRIHLISKAGVEAPTIEEWPEMTKGEVGQQLAARIAQALKGAA